MNHGDIRKHLDQHGVLPSRQLGQNFLTDSTVAKSIVDFLDLQADDCVVEVGPGAGSLTCHVEGRVRKLILVEFDARLAAALQERYQSREDVEVIHEDAARIDTRRFFAERPVKFLGNLPYSSGGAIMKNFLSAPHPFSRVVIMLQKEVIDRLEATPENGDYGMLSLRIQSSWHVKIVKQVPPDVFYPVPQVDSSVALLTPRQDLPAFDRRLFDELLRRGFGQRRKQLHKLLPAGQDWSTVTTELQVPSTVRAEELDLTKWIHLTQMYDTHPLKNIAQKGDEIFDVVNEQDEVIGQATRDEVHAQGLTHRAIHVLVFNKRRDVLLQLRSALKDKFPNVWDSSAAGHLDAGEDYAECAVRELDEELGIKSTAIVEVGKLPPSAGTGWEHVMLFACRHDGAVRFPCSEIDSVQWFSRSCVDAWIAKNPTDFAPGFLQCWQLFKDCQADT